MIIEGILLLAIYGYSLIILLIAGEFIITKMWK